MGVRASLFMQAVHCRLLISSAAIQLHDPDLCGTFRSSRPD